MPTTTTTMATTIKSACNTTHTMKEPPEGIRTDTSSRIRAALETGQTMAETLAVPHCVTIMLVMFITKGAIIKVMVLYRKFANSVKNLLTGLILRLAWVGFSPPSPSASQYLVVKSACIHSLTRLNRNLCITHISAALDSENA